MIWMWLPALEAANCWAETLGQRARERLSLNSLPAPSQRDCGAGEQAKGKAWLLGKQAAKF